MRAQIKRVHDASFGIYGTRRVWHQLRREGVATAKCTVERLMSTMGLAFAYAINRTASDGRPATPRPTVRRDRVPG
ncbi:MULTISPECIES: IS3 family transposase [unclassified Sphingomonas]|uniref:IS3 family transposase n=1 Tax=unclassified Sphingomonas TaxID=196159 RepID=UPI0009E83B5E